MLNLVSPRDFYDDLNYVVTAAEAAAWYGIDYDVIVDAVSTGLVAGRRSVKTVLVSVDSLHAVYGVPALAGGRREILPSPTVRFAQPLDPARGE